MGASHLMKAALSVRGLSKAYSIAPSDSHSPGTLLETLAQGVRRALRPVAASRETFWALREVTFDIDEGEIVGIIGRNGAGKSTLLKVLSRITQPTTGEIDLYGRVGSLLEVGTGFHPELTGRENIFLNGSLLGMPRSEIARQFEAIVDFAAVEKFLDTPVKRYSSGMAVRLAFAVAAHLNPDILIVDEVLTVGDAAFQEKCLGKMQDVARKGRTVLFVSHQMPSVRTLCGQAIVLDGGHLTYQGNTPGAIEHYLQSYRKNISEEAQHPDRRPGSGEYRFVSLTPDAPLMESGGEKEFVFTLRRRKGMPPAAARMYVAVEVIRIEDGVTVTQCDSRLLGAWLAGEAEEINGALRFITPWLKPGSYRMDALLGTAGHILDRWEGACSFDISPLLPYAHLAPGDALAPGIVLADFSFDFDSAAPMKENHYNE